VKKICNREKENGKRGKTDRNYPYVRVTGMALGLKPTQGNFGKTREDGKGERCRPPYPYKLS